MKKIVQRLLIFFISMPLIVAIVIFLPHYNHLILNLLVVIFSALGAAEFSILLTQKKLNITRIEAAILGALPPLVMILIVNLGLNELLLSAVIAAVVSWLLVSHIFTQGDILDRFLNRLAAGLAVLLYPGMLMAWLVRMSRWEEFSSVIILTFLAMVFCNDGLAWAVGKLFGKGNQGIVPVSPKKSIAGFIGGLFASTVIGLGSSLLFPEIFIPQHDSIPVNIPLAGSLLGLLTGIAATFGDLGESAIKRSSGLKDSGNIIPGRGGVLDSIDSIALAAPVFYLAYSLLFVHP
ncbi:MAG: phosphatidate cytidylyltransferase [Treponema sp.]|nr:phosphatidate cytidylyltransferase [Treponema sp.]